MKKLLLSLFLATFAAPAIAADLPPKTVTPVAPAVTTSSPSGWYIDVEGVGSVLKPGGGVNTLAPAGAGVTVGGGYDYTLTNNLVMGVYAKGGWLNVGGTAVCATYSCSAGNTWGGEVGARFGVTIGNMNAALASNSTFQNINGKLPAPLQAITPLQSALLYWKVAAAFEDIKTTVANMGDQRVDVGFRTGPGIEIPLYNSGSTTWDWRTELNVTKYNESICGGCLLPTGRPLEYGASSGVVVKF